MVERRNRNEIRRMKHELNAALLSYMSSDSTIDLHWEQGHNLQALMSKNLLPWEPAEQMALKMKMFKELSDMWIRIHGDPKDPEVARRIEETAAYLNSMAAKGLRR